MQTKRNRRSKQRQRVALLPALRKGLARHVRSHLMVYVPASLPLILFTLAHAGTLLVIVLVKSGVLPQGLAAHKTVVTWAVYGILPLLVCSYGCFFAIARPVTGILERKYPERAPQYHTLAAGGLYGAGVSLALLLLLEPHTVLRFGFLLIIGMGTGLGNWLFYRRLTVSPEEAS